MKYRLWFISLVLILMFLAGSIIYYVENKVMASILIGLVTLIALLLLNFIRDKYKNK
jgi:hypothetical protein